LFRLILGASSVWALCVTVALADPAAVPADDALLDPGVNASNEMMELQAAGPPDADGWSEGALDAARSNLSTSTTGASAVGYVKIEGGRYNSYQDPLYAEYGMVDRSTYTPPPIYP
jgi:hypothetical protein